MASTEKTADMLAARVKAIAAALRQPVEESQQKITELMVGTLDTAFTRFRQVQSIKAVDNPDQRLISIKQGEANLLEGISFFAEGLLCISSGFSQLSLNEADQATLKSEFFRWVQNTLGVTELNGSTTNSESMRGLSQVLGGGRKSIQEGSQVLKALEKSCDLLQQGDIIRHHRRGGQDKKVLLSEYAAYLLKQTLALRERYHKDYPTNRFSYAKIKKDLHAVMPSRDVISLVTAADCNLIERKTIDLLQEKLLKDDPKLSERATQLDSLMQIEPLSQSQLSSMRSVIKQLCQTFLQDKSKLGDLLTRRPGFLVLKEQIKILAEADNGSLEAFLKAIDGNRVLIAKDTDETGAIKTITSR